ncbi:MAG: hypothetical protein ABIH08_00825 [Candidatus Omnitrophota bacterium]
MNKYQWPASRLDEKEMALLFHRKQKTGKSICELLRLAVHEAYGNKPDRVKGGDIKTGKE